MFRNVVGHLLLAAVTYCLVQPASAGDAPGQTATIYRDNWGVPYIYADREDAGFHALGYAQAEDKLERMLRMYMAALGRRAEIDGRSALEEDIRVHLWRHVEESRAAYERLSPQIRANYRAFIAGIRLYMSEHPQQVPAWAPLLEPYLPMLVERSGRWEYVIASGIAKCRSVQPVPTEVARSDEDPFYRRHASNEWSLSPWRTRMKATVLLGDPHTSAFGDRYEFFLKAGRFETMGHTDVGVALPILGHTRFVAWTWTTGAPDTSDCYEIELSPDGNAYRFDGKEVKLVRHVATIRVDGAESRRRQFLYARHNGVLSPVVARNGRKAYVVSSPYMRDWERWDEEMYHQNFARNVDEFRATLSRLGHHGENVMAADASGNTFYVRTGRTPIRPSGFDWSRPVPGNTRATEWLGIHSIDDLVQLKNPVQGYMQNNNVSPALMMTDSPLTPNRYLPYLYNADGRSADGERPRELRGAIANELLSRAYDASVEDVTAIALDQRWPYVAEWTAALAKALARDRPDKRAAEFLQTASRLLHFDGVARAGSVPALTYYYWRKATEKLEPDRLALLTRRIEQHDTLDPADADFLVEAVGDAVAALKAMHGSLDVSLGDVFRIQRGTTSLPIGGPGFKVGAFAYPTLRIIYCRPAESGRLQMAYGGGHALRLVIFTNPIQSFSALLWGQSDDPRSPHYDDQLRLLSESRLKRNHFEWRELEPNIESKRVLRMRARSLR